MQIEKVDIFAVYLSCVMQFDLVYPQREELETEAASLLSSCGHQVEGLKLLLRQASS